MESLHTILLLLFAAVFLVGIAQKCRIPYPIALVLGGAAIGFIPNLHVIDFNPEIILVIVLPPILYYAAFGTIFQDFQRNWRDIFSLALGLVFITTFIIGIIFKWLFPEIPWALAFAFGAIVSPPDAISATTILKRFSMGPRLISLLEGESLINDASAIVLYKLAIIALLSGSFSWMEGGVEFIQEVFGGVILGLISGLVLQLFSKQYLEPVLGILFSFTIPYTTYILAIFLGVSGVIAVVVNGLVGARILFTHHSSLRRVIGYGTWDIFIILLNCFVFILIGLQLKNITSTMNTQQMILYSEYALLITFIMTIIRFIWVYAKAGISYVKALYYPNSKVICNQILREAAVIGWSGMRGIVSLSVAIALPITLPDGSPIEGRNEVIFITFVVIMTTLLIPGITLPWLIQWLNIESQSEHHEMHHTRKKLTKLIKEKLNDFLKAEKIDKNEFDFLQTYFDSHHRVLEMSHSLNNEMLNIEKVRHEMINFQRELLNDLWKQRQIDETVLKHLAQELDLIEVHIARAELK
jgi:CPA1 family monovalent cation:H+ antiporter